MTVSCSVSFLKAGGRTGRDRGDAGCCYTLYGAPVERGDDRLTEVSSPQLPQGGGVRGPGQVVSHVDPQELCVPDALHLSSIDVDRGARGTSSSRRSPSR